MRKILTIDVGGTFIKYAVMMGTRSFKIVTKDKIPTEKTSHEKFLESLTNIFKANNEVEGIAISMPGLIDTYRGVCITAGALKCSNGHCLAEELQSMCGGIPVTVENDANCAALAEIRSGSLTDVKNAFVLVFGTSVGGAFICNREIYHGAHFCAGEIAPTLQNVDSITDHKNDYHHALSAVLFQENCAKILGMPLEDVTGEMIFDLINDNDDAMLDELYQYAQSIAVKIFNLQMLFDPERFAIGGGISSQQSFIDAIQDKIDELYKNAMPYLPRPEIVACKHHNDANLLGALYRYLKR